MLLEKQAEKQMMKDKNDKIKRVKAITTINPIESGYFVGLLTKTQFKKLISGGLTLSEAKKIMVAKIEKDFTKKLNRQLDKIKSIKASQHINFARCEIDWARNRVWGNCPKGSYLNRFKCQNFKSVTGCNFDKLSTLTANMFNSDNNLIAFVMDYIEKHHINKDNIENKLGYGIGIDNGIPYFSHGVGIGCHKRILSKLGFKVQHFETKQSDIIVIDRIK